MCIILIHRPANLEQQLYLYTLSRVPHRKCASVPEPISLYDSFALPSLGFTLETNQEFHLSISQLSITRLPRQRLSLDLTPT